MENNIPKGWVICSLGEILTAKKGKKPSTVINEPRAGYIPYILIDEMEGKPIRTYTNDPKVSIINESEVLLVWDGSIGKCGSGMKGAIGSTLVGLKALGGIQTKFLEYTIKQQFNFIKETSTGTGLQHVNKDFFEICKIPIPPLAEQHRIVAKLDAVMQKVETNKERLEKIPRLLKRFRQSVLAAAVSGKLTEEWRKENKVESAGELILKIQEKRKKAYQEALDNKGKKLRTPADVNFTPLIELNSDFPTSWRQTRFTDISDCLDSIRQPINKTERMKRVGNIPYYGANGQVGWIDDFIFNEDLVIIVEDETFIGREIPFSYIIRGRTWVNNHAHVLRPLENISVEYLNIISSYYDFTPLTSGTTGRRKLTQGSLMNAELSIAPIEEQQEIVRKVEQLFAFAEKLEARFTKAKAMLDKLPQSILAKAFRGELVAQDPNDEPASVLLERIKEEKAKLTAENLPSGKTGKGKKSKKYSIEEKPLKNSSREKAKI